MTSFSFFIYFFIIIKGSSKHEGTTRYNLPICFQICMLWRSAREFFVPPHAAIESISRYSNRHLVDAPTWRYFARRAMQQTVVCIDGEAYARCTLCQARGARCAAF
jgi:hypothetical protein